MKKVIYSVALIAAIASIVLVSCKGGNATGDKYKGETDRPDFDTTVKAGNDFFEYVNGGWLKNNPIPASEARWGSFNIANDTNVARVHHILDAAAADKNKAAGSISQKVGDYYAEALDSAKLNKDGITPLQPELDRINAIKDNKALWSEAAHLMKLGSRVMFSFYVGQDDKISSKKFVSLNKVVCYCLLRTTIQILQPVCV